MTEWGLRDYKLDEPPRDEGPEICQRCGDDVDEQGWCACTEPVDGPAAEDIDEWIGGSV